MHGYWGGNVISGGMLSIDQGAEMVLQSYARVDVEVCDNHGTIRSAPEFNFFNTISGALTNHADGQILVDDQATLVMSAGSVVNAGSIRLESTGNHANLSLDGDLTLTGGGVLDLGDDPDNAVEGWNRTENLINQDNTIQGAGTFNAGLVNHGRHLQDAYIKGVLILFDRLVASGKADRPIPLLLRAADMDPLNEELYVRLMKAYIDQGYPSKAMLIFNQAQDILKKTLSTVPGENLLSVVSRGIRSIPAPD